MEKRPTLRVFSKGHNMPQKSSKSQRKVGSNSTSPQPKRSVAQTTVQSKLKALRLKIPTLTKSTAVLSASNTPTKTRLSVMPFTNLGHWLHSVIRAVFAGQHDLLRQLTDGLRTHAKQCRTEYNEHAKVHAQANAELQADLPVVLYKLVARMRTLFQFRERAYARGTHTLKKYLNRMVVRAKQVADELVHHEQQAKLILDEWATTLENDRAALVQRVHQGADCEPRRSYKTPAPIPGDRLFTTTLHDNTQQLETLLHHGNDLFEKIRQLRQHRIDAFVGGDHALAREVEHHLRKALSQAHAITGARQYFYTANDDPNVIRFNKGTDQLKQELTSLLTLPRLYHNDYELAAHQFQSTIDENIGGMRLFTTLKLRQTFIHAAQELEEELCRQIGVLYKGTQTEMKLLEDELDVLNTEFLAEFARARLSSVLRERVASYITALNMSSDCKIAMMDHEFVGLGAPTRTQSKRTSPGGPPPVVESIEPKVEKKKKTRTRARVVKTKAPIVSVETTPRTSPSTQSDESSGNVSTSDESSSDSSVAVDMLE